MIVAMHVVTAVVWSASIDARAVLTIAVSGLTLSEADFGCFGQRRKHTGWIVCRKTGAYHHWCGLWKSLKTMLGRDRDTGWAKKSKPDNFCNNFVYCQPIFIIFGTYTL